MTPRALALVAVLLVTGCSGDEETDVSTTVTANEVAPATTATDDRQTTSPPSTDATDSPTSAAAPSVTTPATAPDDTSRLDEPETTVPTPPDDIAVGLGPLGETKLRFETDDGSVQIGGGDVPAVIAPTFPVPDDLVVLLASEAGTDAGFNGTTTLGVDELVAMYLDELPAAGFEILSQEGEPGSFTLIDFTGPDGGGQVVISESPGGGSTTLLVAFGDADS